MLGSADKLGVTGAGWLVLLSRRRLSAGESSNLNFPNIVEAKSVIMLVLHQGKKGTMDVFTAWR